MQAELEALTEELVDLAEAKLLEGIRAGEHPSITLYLEAKGRDRGYGRKVEVSGTPGGEPIAVSAVSAIDYSKLSLEELDQLEAIMSKALAPALLTNGKDGALDGVN